MPVQPDSRSLHISAPLTNLSTAYIQSTDAYIADQIFPVVPVQKQGDLFYRYKKDDWFRSAAGVRAPATESVGSGYELDTDSYYAPVYAFHKDIDDQTVANADSMFNLDSDAVNFVTRNLLIKRDRIFVNTYMKTGVWGVDRAGVASGPTGTQFIQFDQSGSTPIEQFQADIVAMEELTGLRPNVLVLGARVINPLLNHAEVLDRIKYTQRGVASPDLLASLFGVDRYLDSWPIAVSLGSNERCHLRVVFERDVSERV